MNWHNTLRSIYSKLDANGFHEISRDIYQGQLSGGTGGEIFDIVITKLISIKNNEPNVYEIIKTETDSLIDYGKSIGYLK
jgi:hypothetical protein